MSKEKNRIDLKDEDLEKVTGGGKPKICGFSNRTDQYTTCPISSVKGQCIQCGSCPLNQV